MTGTFHARQAQARQEMAGDWLLRLQAEDLDQKELASWLEWYSDPDNRAAFDELQSQYERLRGISPDARQQLAAKITDLGDTATHSVRRPAPASRWWAVAATLAIAVIGTSLWAWRSNFESAPGSVHTAVYSTPRAQHENIDLPDSSVVRLGALSSLSLSYTSGARYVVLEGGEAFFEVAHDPRRPFIVQAGGVTVRAVGTQFNVRRSAERVIVTVSEGAVDVTQGSHPKQANLSRQTGQGPVRVTAGEQVSVDMQLARVAVTRTDPEIATAWQSGRLEFVNDPLVTVIATVNRYSSREIVLGDDVGQIRYTGTVFEDRIDEWLLALQDVFALSLTPVSEETVLLSARSGNANK